VLYTTKRHSLNGVFMNAELEAGYQKEEKAFNNLDDFFSVKEISYRNDVIWNTIT